MKVTQHITPVKIAVVLAILLAVWLLIGNKKSALEDAPAPQQKSEHQLAQVEVKFSQAEPWQHEVVVQGQVEPWQEVAVKAQVAGRVEQILKFQGDAVTKGEQLLALTDEGRTERLREAEATLKLRKKELTSASKLEQSRYVAETEISRLESTLEQAKAELVSSELAVQYSRPQAPFDGVVNRRYVDPGQLVSPGDMLMDVVQVDKLKVTAYISQQQVKELQSGQGVTVELLDGRKMTGEVSFVSYSAEPQTRSFYFEVTTPNPEQMRVSGASATLRISLAPVPVHQVSPALLSLNDKGQLGVHTVDDTDVVQFMPVQTLSFDTKGVTIQGLPDSVRLITLGAGFVKPGDKVKAVEATP